MCVQSIKVPIRKKSGNLLNDPRVAEPISTSTPQMNLVKCVRVVTARDNEGRQKVR